MQSTPHILGVQSVVDIIAMVTVHKQKNGLA